MNEFDEAYAGLGRILTPPPDALGRISARVAARRRRRTAGAVALGAGVLVVGAVALLSGGVAERATDPVASPGPTAPTTTVPAPEPTYAVPDHLTCPDTLRSAATFDDFSGVARDATPLDAAARVAPGHPLATAPGSDVVWVLRADGTAYQRLTMIRDRSGRYLPDTIESCAKGPS